MVLGGFSSEARDAGFVPRSALSNLNEPRCVLFDKPNAPLGIVSEHQLERGRRGSDSPLLVSPPAALAM